jgi:hypothetical protein
MLVWDPRKRVQAPMALAHKYLHPYHDPTDEPAAERMFDWTPIDSDLSVDVWKIMMYELDNDSPRYIRLLRDQLHCAPYLDGAS